MIRPAPRADYTYTIEENIIALVDLDRGGRSLTNDIERVLDDLKYDLGDLGGYAIIYRDSQGIWDGIRLQHGCVHFYSLNEQSQEIAARRLLHVIG